MLLVMDILLSMPQEMGNVLLMLGIVLQLQPTHYVTVVSVYDLLLMMLGTVSVLLLTMSRVVVQLGHLLCPSLVGKVTGTWSWIVLSPRLLAVVVACCRRRDHRSQSSMSKVARAVVVTCCRRRDRRSQSVLDDHLHLDRCRCELTVS